MKLVKMSLAAAVLLGASAFAIDNIKLSGDAKVYYGTDDGFDALKGQTGDLFNQGTSYADTALRLSATADLVKNVSAGATFYAVSTLGLENNLVANTWTNAHNNVVDDNWWMGELWVAATMGNTTAKIGRMELDTPLAFSEKWSIVPNTFDAAVLINQDLPGTTLVGAWVGKSNGADVAAFLNGEKLNWGDRDILVRDGAKFGDFGLEGAYAAGIVNNSFKPLVAQAWYYNVSDIADAYWLQADWDCQLVKGVKLGAQYADISPKGTGALLAGNDDSSAYAFKVAYGMDALNVSAAYSKVDDQGGISIQNVATGAGNSGQSKLYTETYWTYGVVGAVDSESFNVTAEYDVKDIAKLGLYYTSTDNDTWNNGMDEVALTASRSFGPLDVTLAYINTDWDTTGDVNALQAYLTLKF